MADRASPWPHDGAASMRASFVGDKSRNRSSKENDMSIGLILLIILAFALVGAVPAWPHSRSWGYGPSGGVGLILVILLILFVLGRI